ncbi:MAG: glycosyltransferase family 9 protein [Methylacidiphilales bacterium]|nr:glycosyltransferase family 9 protein [Candidatus Methylacidiphilales bacterium]
MKILIVKPSALGDIVQALPVLTGLRRQWPDAQIDWIVNDSLSEILDGHPALNKTIHYPRKRWNAPLHLPEIGRWCRKLREEHYDITIDLQGLLRSAIMTWAAGSPRRLGLTSAREGAGFAYNEYIADTAISNAERYLTCLEYLGIPVQPHDFQLIPRAPLPDSLQSLGPYIALHPYSKWRTKYWPWRYYQELIDSMPEAHFVAVGQGPWFPLEAEGRLIDLRNCLSLSTLVTVLHKAQVVLSTDSGPAHIAGALGRPTLVLYGATDWRESKPLGSHVRVHTHALFCSPCQKRTCWRDTPIECMSLLTPKKVRTLLLSLAL